MKVACQCGAHCDVCFNLYYQVELGGLNATRDNLGVVVFDEAHCVGGNMSFHPCLESFGQYNFSLFKKVILVSAIFSRHMAEKMFQMLHVKGPLVYSKLFDFYSHVG